MHGLKAVPTDLELPSAADAPISWVGNGEPAIIGIQRVRREIPELIEPEVRFARIKRHFIMRGVCRPLRGLVLGAVGMHGLKAVPTDLELPPAAEARISWAGNGSTRAVVGIQQVQRVIPQCQRVRGALRMESISLRASLPPASRAGSWGRVHARPEGRAYRS